MGTNLRHGRNDPLSISPKSPHHKRLERQTKAQELTRCHLLRWPVPSCRTSVTYLGGMPVLKYSSMRLTSAGEKIFFSINRKGTLQASRIRRRTPAFWMVKSVPLTWEQRNICGHHLVPTSKKNLSSLSLGLLNPWIKFYFQDSNCITQWLFLYQHLKPCQRSLADCAFDGSLRVGLKSPSKAWRSPLSWVAGLSLQVGELHAYSTLSLGSKLQPAEIRCQPQYHCSRRSLTATLVQKKISCLPRHRNPPSEFRFGTLMEPHSLIYP